MLRQTLPQHLHDIVLNTIAGTNNYEMALRSLSFEDRDLCLQAMLSVARTQPNHWNAVLAATSLVLDMQPLSMRFRSLAFVIEGVRTSAQPLTVEQIQNIPFDFIADMQPLEWVNLANQFSDMLGSVDRVDLKKIGVMGLGNLMQHLHPVNQKEYAFELFLRHNDRELNQPILDVLTNLVFNLQQRDRREMVLFFSDVIKRNDDIEATRFVCRLLEQVIATLPGTDRVMIADYVAPLLFYTDTRVVCVALQYFSNTITVLPETERYHYAHLISGLASDQSVRNEVLMVLHRAIPYLNSEDEKQHLGRIVMDYSGRDFKTNYLSMYLDLDVQ